MKFFTAVKIRCILHGRVFVMIKKLTENPLIKSLMNFVRSCLVGLFFIPSYFLRLKRALLPTDSALLRTDLSPLTNGIWEINAECSCFLHLPLLAKIG